MRATSIIYRRELAGYLRSPITWVIAAVLLRDFSRGRDDATVVVARAAGRDAVRNKIGS